VAYVVGMTGGIGSGKTEVAKAFSALGVEVVDADAISHRLSMPGQAGHAAISAAFDPGVLLPSGELDRAELRRRAFADPEARARELHAEEVERCREMSGHAAGLLGEGTRALTHCNTGALATAGQGTALGALREAWARGLVRHVFVDETRPLLQGARLTAWELDAEGIPHTVVADAAAGHLLATGEVDCVLVGADRIAANGDTANKIGTYPLAVLAARHGVPFYVVAPTSTVDPETPSGALIPIEERDPVEVTRRFAARNPAFDVTPGELISAIVTELGVHRQPYVESLPRSVTA